MSPYIPDQERPNLNPIIYEMVVKIDKPGKLAYVLFKFFRSLKPNFLTFCIWIGTLVLTVFEIYRRIIGPYEDAKKAENGEVE